jgi:hypothetical protein
MKFDKFIPEQTKLTKASSNFQIIISITIQFKQCIWTSQVDSG